MTNEERWVAFINELRAYVEEHHLFPDKHTRFVIAHLPHVCPQAEIRPVP